MMCSRHSTGWSRLSTALFLCALLIDGCQVPPSGALSSEQTARLKSAAQIHSTYILDERLRLFDVVDEVAKSFQSGELPLERESAGQKLADYWKRRNRWSQESRERLYARLLGIRPAPTQMKVNKYFSSLWAAFLSDVSRFDRKKAGNPKNQWALLTAIDQASRRLQGNLVEFSAATDAQTAKELASLEVYALAVLNDPAIAAAYGLEEESAWSLLEKVSTSELGHSAQVEHLRQMAASSKNIIEWLASQAGRFTELVQTADTTEAEQTLPVLLPLLESVEAFQEAERELKETEQDEKN